MVLTVVSVFIINKLQILDNVSFYNNALDQFVVFLIFYNFYIFQELSKDRYILLDLYLFFIVIGLFYSISSIYYQRVVDFRVGVDLSYFTLFLTTFTILFVTNRNLSYENESLEDDEIGDVLK